MVSHSQAAITPFLNSSNQRIPDKSSSFQVHILFTPYRTSKNVSKKLNNTGHEQNSSLLYHVFEACSQKLCRRFFSSIHSKSRKGNHLVTFHSKCLLFTHKTMHLQPTKTNTCISLQISFGSTIFQLHVERHSTTPHCSPTNFKQFSFNLVYQKGSHCLILQKTNQKSLSLMQKTNQKSLSHMQKTNQKSLSHMQKTSSDCLLYRRPQRSHCLLCRIELSLFDSERITLHLCNRYILI